MPPDHVVVITASDLVPEIERECPGATAVGEPMQRNTAPAIAAASAWFPETAAFAVLWADHAIDDVAAFTSDFQRAFALAERENVLVTFGIPATWPETNLGYIQRGPAFKDGAHRVAAFKEKPDRERAEAWLASGECLWNCGIFVWRRAVFMDALQAGRPELARAFRGFSFDGSVAGFESRLREIFPRVEAVSVDHAVLERAPNAVVIEASFDWDDLGSWNAWAARRRRSGPRPDVAGMWRSRPPSATPAGRQPTPPGSRHASCRRPVTPRGSWTGSRRRAWS